MSKARALRGHAHSALRALGLEVRRTQRPRDQARRAAEWGADADQKSFLDGVLQMLLVEGQRLRVVQVGANDGVCDDPVRGFLMREAERTAVLLIEPQEDVAELLRGHYATHPDATVAVRAIGSHRTLSLYRIKPEFHARYRGRIASGITSADRDYVLGKAASNGGAPAGTDPTTMIEEYQVLSIELPALMEEIGWGPEYDVLQVDTEGFDDEVIYHAGLGDRRPAVVNYEYVHLSEERLHTLHRYLLDNGYRVLRWSDHDECALRVTSGARRRPISG